MFLKVAPSQTVEKSLRDGLGFGISRGPCGVGQLGVLLGGPVAGWQTEPTAGTSQLVQEVGSVRPESGQQIAQGHWWEDL